jgi:hypothetical protein
MKWRATMFTLLVASIVACTAGASAQAIIKVSDDVSLRFGMMTQFQAQFTQDRSSALQDTTANFSKKWARNMFLRRMRFFLGGTVGKDFSFFLMTDDFNYGKVSAAGVKAQGGGDASFVKSTPNPMFVQEAYISYTPMTEFSVIGGLQLVGITRNGLQSASTLGTVDYGSYSFTQSGPTGNMVGRDFGVTLRGFLAEERLEYRAGMYSGINRDLYSPFRIVGWVNYSFLDKEKGIYYTGNTLGKGKVFSVGAGVDLQRTYFGIGGSAFLDYPVTETGSLVANLNAQFLNGGVDSSNLAYLSEYTRSLPKQINFLGELGYYFSEYKIEPFVRVDLKSISSSDSTQLNIANLGPILSNPNALENAKQLGSESRFGVGFIYWFLGHNSNLKLYYEMISYNRLGLSSSAILHPPSTTPTPTTTTESKSQSQVTLQWQWHFY